MFQSSSTLRDCTWLNLDIRVFHDGLGWTIKNPNRHWLWGEGEKAFDQYVQWPGQLPMAFRQLRGLLLGRAAQAEAAGLPSGAVAYTLLEMVVELQEMSYP